MNTTSRYYSQFGEDRLLDKLFGHKKSGLCVEVGANNGVDDSTTYFFEKHGWDCILIEPNPELIANLRKKRSGQIFECAISDTPGTTQLNIVDGAERSHGMSSISNSRSFHKTVEKMGFQTKAVTVQVTTLDNVLVEANMAGKIDFISIDVEGLELGVLKGLSLDRWRPRVILMEDNSHYSNSDVAFYLGQFGYHRFRRTGVNDWFAHVTDRDLVNWISKSRVLFNRPYIQLSHLIKQTRPYQSLQSFYRRLKS